MSEDDNTPDPNNPADDRTVPREPSEQLRRDYDKERKSSLGHAEYVREGLETNLREMEKMEREGKYVDPELKRKTIHEINKERKKFGRPDNELLDE